MCFSCFRVCSLLPCGHLLGKGDFLALVGDVFCVFVTFPFGILGQVWYLIVSFSDLCRLSYYNNVFGISDQVRLKLVCSAKQTRKSNGISHETSLGI